MSASRRRLLQLLGMTFLATRMNRASAAAAPLTVLTGLPPPMVAMVETEFRAAHPGIELRMLWRSGRQALPLLEAGPAQVDVYWAAAARNFHALAEGGRLRRLGVERRELPGRVGAQLQSDAQGRFEATDTAGYVVVTNESCLADLGLPVPTNFADLADPRLHGHVVLPVPGKIGFAAPLYAHWLQVHGWQAGFELLLDIAANAELCGAHGGEITARLARGEAGAGITLDFFAREAVRGGAILGLRYPADTLYSPTHVGILNEAGNLPAARCFVDFLLSARGQQLMAAPQAARLPMRPAVYRRLAPQAVDPFRAQRTVPHDIHAGLRRQPLVTLLFDAAIASHHERLASLWHGMAEARRSGTRDPATLAAARSLATRLPLTAAEADRLALRSDDPRSRALREQWRGFFARNYRAAAELLASGAST